MKATQQQLHSKGRQQQQRKSRAQASHPDAAAAPTAGLPAPDTDADGKEHSGFDYGDDDSDLPATQAEAWQAAGAIAAATQGYSKDTADDAAQQDEDEGWEHDGEEPAQSQPAKLTTAAKLQRSKPQQRQQIKQRGGRSTAEPQEGGTQAQLAAFKTPHAAAEPEPRAKKGAVTATTGTAAAVG